MKKIFFLLSLVIVGSTAKAQFYNNAFKIQSTGTDKGMRITTDKSGNVITTGSFGDLADFDPGTNTATLTPGGISDDVYIAKYDASLNYQWAVKFGTSGTDFAYALATDASDNIIIGGDMSTNSRDGFVNKYDPAGTLIWSISIGGANKDVVYGVNTDAAKNVYVTGYFSNTVDFDPGAATYTLASNGGRDIFLAKYDSSGNFRWAFNVGGTISTAYEEGGQDIVIAGPNIYLTGNFEGTADFDPIGTNTLTSNGSLDIFVAKYDTTGAYIWAFGVGSSTKHDYSYGIDLDASENVFITGGFEETVDFDPSGSTATLVSGSVNAQDIFVAKYSSAGAYQWAFRVGGNTSVDDHAFDIDVTPSGDFYICGEVWGPADFDPSIGTANISTSNDQIFFAKYTGAGNFDWVFEVGSTSGNGSADNGYGVHVGSNGMLYATGDFSGTADFDPNSGTASLTSSGGDAFVAVYGTAVSGIGPIASDPGSAKAFPNPSAGEVSFSCPTAANETWNLDIADVTGKTILKFAGIHTKIFTADLKDLEAGVYFYTISTREGTFTKKFVIQ